MYFAYRIAEADRARLLLAFPPAPGMEAVCDHVTRMVGREVDLPLGSSARIMVVGRLRDAGNDVLVVTVNGTLERPDGRPYHITLAVDRAGGARPSRSNELLEAAVQAQGLQALRNLAPPRIEFTGTLEAFGTPKTPRAPKSKRAELPVKRTPLGSGLVREDTNDGRRLRTRIRCPEGTTIGIRVVDIATGRVMVDKGLFGDAARAADALGAWLQANAAPKPPR